MAVSNPVTDINTLLSGRESVKPITRDERTKIEDVKKFLVSRQFAGPKWSDEDICGMLRSTSLNVQDAGARILEGMSELYTFAHSV